MKKLILINLILLSLIYLLPSEKVQIKQQIAVAVEQVETVSSRSLETPRQEVEQPTEILGISQKGIDYIKSKEAQDQENFTAYLNDGEQYYTIGYGHTGADVKPGQTISKEQAERLLENDLQGYSEYVLNYCSYLNLTQNEADALISFCYNLGCGWLQTLTANKTRTKAEIAEHITAYTSSNETFKKGLLQRRQEEKNIFLGGEYQ